MFKVLFLMLLLLAGLIGGPYLAGKQGYVLIETATYRYEMSITVLVLLFVLSLALVYLLEWIVSRFLRLSHQSYTWFARRKRLKAQRQTLEGLEALNEGNYKKAQRLIGDNAKYSDKPVLNLITAAEAAQKAGNDLAANRYLLEATEIGGKNNLMVAIARVKILVEQQKWQEARLAVDELLNRTNGNKEVLVLAVKIYQKEQAYEALDGILEQIEKAQLYDATHFNAFENQVENGLLDEKLQKEGKEGLLAWWKAQTRGRRRKFALKLAMIRRLLDSDDHENAYEIMLDAAKTSEEEAKNFFPVLHEQIARLQRTETEKLRKILEKQAPKAQKFRTDIYRALGYLYVRANDFSKASQAFSEVLKDKAHLQEKDLTMAAFVFEQNGEIDLATKVRAESVQHALPQVENAEDKA